MSSVGEQIANELGRTRFFQNRGLALVPDLSCATLRELSSSILKRIRLSSERGAQGFVEALWRKLRPPSRVCEQAWKTEIDDALWGTGNPYWAFGAAIALLTTLWLRWADYPPDASGADFLRVGERGRLSLRKVMGDFESRADEPLTRIFSWATEEYVIGQHLRISAQKLAREGIDT